MMSKTVVRGICHPDDLSSCVRCVKQRDDSGCLGGFDCGFNVAQ